MELSPLEQRQFRDLESSRLAGIAAVYDIRDYIMSHPNPYLVNGPRRIWDHRWQEKIRELWRDLIEETDIGTAIELNAIMEDWVGENGYQLPSVIASSEVLDELIEDLNSERATRTPLMEPWRFGSGRF